MSTAAIRRVGKDRFLIVEGGGRLSSFSPNGNTVTVENLKEEFVTPTGVTVVGRVAWVSEGQLSHVFDPRKKTQTPKLPFQIYSIDLHGRKNPGTAAAVRA